MYRWECRNCKKRGRWYKDGNLAQVFGTRHEDRHCDKRGNLTHRAYIYDESGRSHGPAS